MLIRLLATTLSLLISDYLIDGIRIDGLWAALVAGLLLGIVNLFLRPVFVFFTLPFTIATFGLFLFVINAILYLLVAGIVPGFEVDGFTSALLGSVVTSLMGWLIHSVLKESR